MYATPKFFKARTVPLALKEKVEKELDKLQSMKIISPVQFSTWAAPIVPVLNRLWAIDANWRHIRNVRYRRLTPNGVKAVFFAFFVHSARLLRSTSCLWLAADRRY